MSSGQQLLWTVVSFRYHVEAHQQSKQGPDLNFVSLMETLVGSEGQHVVPNTQPLDLGMTELLLDHLKQVPGSENKIKIMILFTMRQALSDEGGPPPTSNQSDIRWIAALTGLRKPATYGGAYPTPTPNLPCNSCTVNRKTPLQAPASAMPQSPPEKLADG